MPTRKLLFWLFLIIFCLSLVDKSDFVSSTTSSSTSPLAQKLTLFAEIDADLTLETGFAKLTPETLNVIHYHLSLVCILIISYNT